VQRGALPFGPDRVFLAEGGQETELIFREGIDLPCFASFPLVESEDGRAALHRYYAPFLEVARRQGLGIVLDAPTWRANRDWGAGLGYDAERLADANRAAVAFVEDLRIRYGDETAILISGAIGPRGDAYDPEALMTAEDAERYHEAQVVTLAGTTVDLVSALTMTYAEEAIGITRAAGNAGVPVVVSFTVETDGRLPGGQALGEAIELVDAETDAGPSFFMINCAHPTHFAGALTAGASWLDRIGGLRCNASAKSHAELDESEELDEGDPAELAALHSSIRDRLRHVRLLGGCCGTGHRHVDAIASAWLTA
jgi:S-methylmethionine-dependent homocysteine/selenocysteine methylase